MPRSWMLRLVTCLAALAVAAPLASGQSLRVRLVDEDSRLPLTGVLVSALGPDGAIGATVLSSGEGIATVRVPNGDPHRLLVRRIGFAPVTTEPVVAPSEPARLTEIVVPSHRITLGAVKVIGNQSCSENAESPSPSAQAAWTEVRTALEASALTRDQRLVTTSALRFQRDLRRDGTVNFADTTLRGRSGERPFFAPPPAVLERDGYFKRHDDGSEDFYAPDEASLLSPGFTRLHCITPFPGVRRSADGAQLALAFVPRDRGTRPEIRGLIWIDSATSELRRIEFEYVRIALRAVADSIGGSVEFRHLVSGAWIVSSWSLRMPRFRVVDRRANITVLDSYIEVGGSASVLRDVATPGPNVPRSIVGTVFDSIAQRPLAGAHVHLADLAREVVADSLGRFRFDSVGAGEHSVWADHPTLDALGLYSLGAQVDATPQVANSVALAIPSFATMWRRACGPEPVPQNGDGFVFGRVRDGQSSRAERGTEIAISWPAAASAGAPATANGSVRAKADSTGGYAVCGVPAQQPVTLAITAAGSATMPVSFRLGASRVARRDFLLPPDATLDSLAADSSRVAPGPSADGATLSGVVRDSAGLPVRDARVSVSGVRGEWKADAQGGFTLHGIPPGVRTVAIDAIGFLPERRLANLAAQDSAWVPFALARGAAVAVAHTLRVVSADGRAVMYANAIIEGGTTQITNERGEIPLGLGSTQGLTLSVRRIGFAPWFGKIEFHDTSSVFTVTLTHVAQQLGEVRVTGQKNPSSPFVQGFYDRWLDRQKGLLSAVFIGPEELESRHPDMITNMLRGLNGLCLSGVSGDPHKVIIFSSHFASLLPNDGCPACPMAIVVDGMQQYPPPGGYVYVDVLFSANEIMGIEVYPRAGNMPISLQVNDTKCGVVAFWTGSRH